MTTFPLCTPMPTPSSHPMQDDTPPSSTDLAAQSAKPRLAGDAPDQTPVVYVVDDDLAVLDAMTLLIHSAGLKPLAFSSAQAFLDAFTPDHVACLVLDIRMPGMDGMVLQEQLLAIEATLPIIFMTGHGDVAQCSTAFKRGAHDFLQKPVYGDVLLKQIQTALKKSISLLKRGAKTQEAEARLASLSEREHQVLKLVTEGLSSREIGAKLDLSRRTIEAHRATLFDKLGVNSLAELIRLYLYGVDERQEDEGGLHGKG